MHPTELHNCSCGQSQFAAEAASLVHSCTSVNSSSHRTVQKVESRQSEPYFHSETSRFSNTRHTEDKLEVYEFDNQALFDTLDCEGLLDGAHEPTRRK